jgi:hypothetical protein
MARIRYTPSTTPVSPPPSPLLLFIQQAQMALVSAEAEADRLKAIEQPPEAAA